jgi:hypothetical protein
MGLRYKPAGRLLPSASIVMWVLQKSKVNAGNHRSLVRATPDCVSDRCRLCIGVCGFGRYAEAA